MGLLSPLCHNPAHDAPEITTPAPVHTRTHNIRLNVWTGNPLFRREKV